MQYALKWLEWKDTGFKNETCPWRNPYEMRRNIHTPKPEALEQAKVLRQSQSIETQS